MFGLQFSNPVDTSVAYKGNAKNNGQANDPMLGSKIGGVNVFGGGLAMYNEDGEMVGAIGVSGDTSCTDHIIAWRVRDALGLDNIPGGVGDGFTNDNLILNNPPTTNSFEHPTCGFGEELIIPNLATNFPVGP
ncbi:MAG: heme-binding protein [Proteobacteria bacterium]|nr:heme-binding protein [Pseudomonadota bacterium]